MPKNRLKKPLFFCFADRDRFPIQKGGLHSFFPGFQKTTGFASAGEKEAIFMQINNASMKKILFSSLLLIGLGAMAQTKEKVPAAKGVVYGIVAEERSPATPDELAARLVNNQYEGQLKARVVDVCKAEGCWLKVERKDGSAMMVRAKDHAFLVPENIVGKTVLIDGSATVKETSEEMRKHYAEDAGKSKEEIAKIKGTEKDIQFAAKGVKVLD
jgi:hypothetical protein